MKKMQCHIISNSRWCPSSTAPSLLAKQPGHSPDNLPPVLSEWSPNHIGLHRVLSYSVITHAVRFGMLCTYRVMYRAVCWGGGGGGQHRERFTSLPLHTPCIVRNISSQLPAHTSRRWHARWVKTGICVHVCMLVQQNLLNRIP